MHRLLWPLALLLACAPKLVLPPAAVPTSEWQQPSASAPRVPKAAAGAPLVRHDFDTLTGYTRRLVTTHPGTYSGWMQKPQISFFALTRGTAAPEFVPASIGLIVRTLEPEALSGPRLVLQCDALADTIPVAVQSHVAPTGNTRSHFLTYLLPTAHVSAFASCSNGKLLVGQTATSFSAIQLGGIRALLLELGAQLSTDAP